MCIRDSTRSHLQRVRASNSSERQSAGTEGFDHASPRIVRARSGASSAKNLNQLRVLETIELELACNGLPIVKLNDTDGLRANMKLRA